MTKEQLKISIQEVTRMVALLVKEEILATYTEGENCFWLSFLNGQKFRIGIEEV